MRRLADMATCIMHCNCNCSISQMRFDTVQHLDSRQQSTPKFRHYGTVFKYTFVKHWDKFRRRQNLLFPRAVGRRRRRRPRRRRFREVFTSRCTTAICCKISVMPFTINLQHWRKSSKNDADVFCNSPWYSNETQRRKSKSVFVDNFVKMKADAKSFV